MPKFRNLMAVFLVLTTGLTSGCAGDDADCGNGRGEVGAEQTARSLLEAAVEGDVERACDMIGGTQRPDRTGLVEPLEDLAQIVGDTPIEDVDITEAMQLGSHVTVHVTVPGQATMEFNVVLDHNTRGQVLDWPGLYEETAIGQGE